MCISLVAGAAVEQRSAVHTMPLVIDNNTRSWESFDVQTASTLYWKSIPVLVKQHDREEQTVELTVRILSGVNRNNHNSRVNS